MHPHLFNRNGRKVQVKRKRNTEKVSVRENFMKYLLNSTLHGLTYVGDSKLTWFERGFFAFSFCLVLAFSSYFISNVWAKWSASPVIITLNSLATPLTEFPFPAITICNMNQAKRSKVRNIPSASSNYFILQTLCSSSNVPNASDSKEKWPQFKHFMMRVAQSCEDMLLYCSYGGNIENCYQIFNTVLTDEGICCNFNGVHPKFLVKEYKPDDAFNVSDAPAHNWTPETGFRTDEFLNKRDSYPRPPVGTGNELGLNVILNANINDYYCSSMNSYGFKVLLHNPIESPKISYYGMLVSPGFETQIVVTPSLAHSSNNIRSVPKKLRACKFENENDLSYFRTYSRRNCEMECESRLYMQNCKCIMYYMPKINDDANICGRSDQQCLDMMKEKMKLKLNESIECDDCYPSCYAVSYDGELSSAPILRPKELLPNEYASTIFNQHSINDLAILHIFFRENSFRSQKREELIGFTEFLSNTGGLLGLFMGFSVISIIELIYFMTFRPYCAQKRYDNENHHHTKTQNSGEKTHKKKNTTKISVISCFQNSKKTDWFRRNDNDVYPYVD